MYVTMIVFWGVNRMTQVKTYDKDSYMIRQTIYLTVLLILNTKRNSRMHSEQDLFRLTRLFFIYQKWRASHFDVKSDRVVVVLFGVARYGTVVWK